jgi:hypothetical protein
MLIQACTVTGQVENSRARCIMHTPIQTLTDNGTAPGPTLTNEKLSLRTTLITKLLTNPLAQWPSTADSGGQSRASWRVNLTGQLSMAWKRSGVRVP